MTSKEFVKSSHPRARAEKHKTNDKKTYWLIRPEIHRMYIGVGKTEASAWVKAKERILEAEKDALIIAGIL